MMEQRKPYPTDISNTECTILEPLIPEPKTGGRLRTVNMREIVNAIFYVLAAGRAWRLMPHDLPPCLQFIITCGVGALKELE